MTVQTNTTVATGIGNGVTSVFPIPFKFNRAEDLIVYLVIQETEEEIPLTLHSDYTVTGAGNENGGNLTMLAGPLPVGQSVVAQRIVDLRQLTDLRNQGRFFAEVHEDVFDKLVMIDQQQQTHLDRAMAVDLLWRWNALNRRIINLGDPAADKDATHKQYVDEGDLQARRYAHAIVDDHSARALRTPDTIAPVPAENERAGKILAFNSQGNPITVIPVSDSAAQLRLDLADPSIGTDIIAYGNRSLSEALESISRSGHQGANLLHKLVGYANMRGAYIRNHDSRVIAVGMAMEGSLGSIIEYRFRYDGDGLLLLRGGYVGVEDPATSLAEVTLAGTYNTSSAPQTYTTTVGDKFTATFKGDTLRFLSRVDDRGGVWKVTLDNGMSRNVSTWAPTPTLVREQVVFEKLEYRDYLVEFEFIGEDPLHAPSSAARGWLRYADGDAGQQPLKVRAHGLLDLATAIPVVSQNSIPDFAINAKLSSAPYGHEWVPQHGSIGGVSQEIELKLLIDGVLVTQAPRSMLPASMDGMPFKKMLLVQSFVARNPNGSEANRSMWRHTITHSLRADDPTIRINNRIDVLQDTEITQAYFGMLPAESVNVTRLVLNNGIDLPDIAAPGAPTEFGWDVSSAMYTGEFAPGNFHGAACWVPSMKDSASFGTEMEPPTVGRITYRSDGVTKVYWHAMRAGVLRAGDVVRSEHHIALVAGIRYPDYLIRSI